MRVIIAGGRDYQLSNKDFTILDYFKSKVEVTEIVSGGCRGADYGGELWAQKNKIKVIKFPVDWNKYGKIAGLIRNAEMAVYADCLVLFPGGKGSTNMLEIAKEFNLDIYKIKDGNMFKTIYEKSREE